VKSLTELLGTFQAGLAASSALNAFAAELKKDEPGTAGRLTVVRGNEYIAKTLPLDLYPFALLVVGSEKARTETFGVTTIRREFKVQGGIFDNATERCTDRLVQFEETMVREIKAILGSLVMTDEAPDNLIVTYDIRPVLSDSDVNRPRALRTVPVEVTYLLEEDDA
jgi:hypothetical protein